MLDHVSVEVAPSKRCFLAGLSGMSIASSSSSGGDRGDSRDDLPGSLSRDDELVASLLSRQLVDWLKEGSEFQLLDLRRNDLSRPLPSFAVLSVSDDLSSPGKSVGKLNDETVRLFGRGELGGDNEDGSGSRILNASLKAASSSSEALDSDFERSRAFLPSSV